MGWTRYLTRTRRDDGVADEIASYIAVETDENIARGMTPEEARAAAIRKFGNPTRTREDVYFMNTIRPVDTLVQDFRYALRLLRRDKGFALAAVLSLTLGIGANTAIFQLLDAVRLRTLPVPNPEELVEVRIPPGSRTGTFNGRHPRFTYPQWEKLQQDQQQALTNLFAWGAQRFNTSPTGEVHCVEGLYVSGDFFGALGVQPLMGRLFTPADDRRGCGEPGAVISYAFWQREMGGDPGGLSRTVTLDGYRFPIIGVTPPSFFGMEVGRRFDVAVPLCADAVLRGGGRFDERATWWLAVAGTPEAGLDPRAGDQVPDGTLARPLRRDGAGKLRRPRCKELSRLPAAGDGRRPHRPTGCAVFGWFRIAHQLRDAPAFCPWPFASNPLQFTRLAPMNRFDQYCALS